MRRYIVAAFVSLMVAALLLACGITPTPRAPALSPEDARDTATEISYDKLARDTESYVGAVIHVRGRIIQAMEQAGDRYQFRVAVDDGTAYSGDVVFVRWQGARFLDDDHVDLWGEVLGRLTYTSALGGEITLPDVQAADMALVTEAP